jgi:Uma2 family endonuclease
MASPARTRPPLQSGDRLSRAAFHAIYSERADIDRAELVKGIVYVPSPAGFEGHAKPQSLIGLWLGAYAARHDDVDSGIEATLLLADDTEVQPDGLLFRLNGGLAAISEDDYIVGAPELVVEVASSSAAYDLHDKKDAYMAAGVGEYVVWDTHAGRIHWFVRSRDEYQEVEATSRVFESAQFPGLRLDVQAALDGDRRRLLAALE